MEAMKEADQSNPDTEAQAEESEISALPPSPGYGLQGKALADYLKQLSIRDNEKTRAP